MESQSHFLQCPGAPDMGRRTSAVTSEESVGVRTSKPEACESGLFDLPPTAAAQRQAPSTMPKAATLVAGWWPSDENEETSLQDQPLLPSLTLKGTVCLENADPSRSFALHASITENASESAAHHYGAQCWNWKNLTTEERKSQYCRDLCLQIEERKHQRERERNRDVLDEQKHNDTIQRNVWGLPGSGAPNYHLGTARRSERLRLAGILPQQQVNEAAGLSPALLQPTGAQCSQGGKEKTKKRECLQPKLCVTNEDCVSCKVLTTRKLYKPAFCCPRNKHHDIPKS